MLEQPETSLLEKNLRFVKNEIGDQLDELFTESQQQSRAPFKMVKPYPGICLKTFKEGSKDKFFINICHTKEIPAPKDISETELHKLIENQNATDFKVPLSVTKPRMGKDKSGKPAEISDVAINSEFYAKKIKRGDGLFYHFLITLVFESLEQKYKITVDGSNFVLLKNRPCVDQLIEHQIYSRDVKTVENYHAANENVAEVLGADDSDSIVIGKPEQKLKAGKKLIEEITPQSFKPRKSITNINEPEFRIIADSDEFNRQVLIAEFYLPHVRSVDEVKVEVNDDRLILSSKDLSFEGFLPQTVDEKKTQAEFDLERTLLIVTMTA